MHEFHCRKSHPSVASRSDRPLSKIGGQTLLAFVELTHVGEDAGACLRDRCHSASALPSSRKTPLYASLLQVVYCHRHQLYELIAPVSTRENLECILLSLCRSLTSDRVTFLTISSESTPSSRLMNVREASTTLVDHRRHTCCSPARGALSSAISIAVRRISSRPASRRSSRPAPPLPLPGYI